MLERIVTRLLGSEAWSAAGLLGWGCWVWWTGAALEDLPSYDPLSEFIPPWAWAYGALGIGAAQLAAIVWGRKRARVPTAFLAMVFYKLIAVSIMVSPTPGPNAMVLCALAFADMAAVAILFVRGVLAWAEARQPHAG